MARQIPDDYIHTIPPENFDEWHRWIDHELFLIEQALRANPIVMAIDGSDTIAVASTITTETLGIGDTPTIDLPGGDYDVATGIWTCPQAGLYNLHASAVFEIFGTGSKSYTAGLAIFKNAVSFLDIESGGNQDSALSMIMSAPILLLQGDTLSAELSTIHSGATETAPYRYNCSYIRQASS